MGTTQTQAVASIVSLEMETQGISVKSLAEEASIARTTLMRRLSGESPFTLNELESIARVLGVSASELMAAADAVRVA